MINLYAGFGWIILRLALHAAIIFLGVYVWYKTINTGWYVWFFVGWLCLIYAALVYNQVRLPLLTVSNDKFIIRNFFFRGKTQILFSEVSGIHVHKYRIVFRCNGKDFVVSLIGISQRRTQESKRKLSRLAEDLGLSFN